MRTVVYLYGPLRRLFRLRYGQGGRNVSGGRRPVGVGKADANTFRIRIWFEDAGADVIVYDNGVTQAVSGGNIIVQTK